MGCGRPGPTGYSTVQYQSTCSYAVNQNPWAPLFPTQLSIGCANACRRFTSTPSCKTLSLRCTLRWAHRPGCGPSQRDGKARVQFLLRALARAEPVPQTRTAGRVQIRARLERPVSRTTGRGGGSLRCELLKTFHVGLPSIRGKSEVVPLCAKARVSDATVPQTARHRKKENPSRYSCQDHRPAFETRSSTGPRRQQVGA